MKVPLWLSGIILIIASCNQNSPTQEFANHHKNNPDSSFYSKIVGDSFSISVDLPGGYNAQESGRYPVVYLLDANIYFDILATTLHKYGELGMAPSVILIGIGYKDFETMDSLRNRDYTYPVAIPEYEMNVSGGADRFLNFIRNELFSFIDKQYKTDTSHRILMGHSLGGYFAAYALIEQLSGKTKAFDSYISASPSLHYNKYYLVDKLKETTQPGNNNKIKAYFTFGGLEDEENADEEGIRDVGELSQHLSKLFSEKFSKKVEFKCDVYSNFGHMETPIPTFTKGLNWTLGRHDDD